jgi:hypothetical protein
MSAVMLFYPLIVAAPEMSIVAILLQRRSQRQTHGPE